MIYMYIVVSIDNMNVQQENDTKMPSESKTNTITTRKPRTKLPKRQKDVGKLSL
jgi:hypothetical protein